MPIGTKCTDPTHVIKKNGKQCGTCHTAARQARRYSGYVMKPACEVCGSVKNLAVDHDHSCCDTTSSDRVRSCGKCVRGTLCRDCNAALTHDVTPDVLRALADYLEQYEGND